LASERFVCGLSDGCESLRAHHSFTGGSAYCYRMGK
jgi:hypothetical protein